jgi:hypothetical protein
MKAKHTPGPWYVELGYKGGAKYPGIESENDVSVVVWGDDTIEDDLVGVQGRTKKEAKANAKLIASSPDLLQALVAVSAAIQNRELLNDELRSVMDQVDNAIKKAV